MAINKYVIGSIFGCLLALLIQILSETLLQDSLHQLKSLLGSRVSREEFKEDEALEYRFLAEACNETLSSQHYAGLFDGVSSNDTARYRLTYFLADSTVKLANLRKKETTLKRNVYPDVRRSDLHLGSSVVLGSDCFTLTAYSDDRTGRAVRRARQSTFAMVKPDAMARVGEVLTAITRHSGDGEELSIAGLRMVRLTRGQAEHFYAEHRGRTFFEPLVSYITRGPVLALHLVGRNAVKGWRAALGPTSSEEARATAPASIRALFGTDKQENAAHGSDSEHAAQRELSLFLAGEAAAVESSRPSLPSSAELLCRTCCLALPHLLRDGSLGPLITHLLEEHQSSLLRAELVRFSHLDAARYSTALLLPPHDTHSQQKAMMNILMVGPGGVMLQLQPSSPTESQEQFERRFNDVIGPRDPKKARQSAVGSVRAAFGQTRERSGVLCPWYDWSDSVE